MNPSRISALLVVIALLVLASVASAQDRVAQLSSVDGQVTIQRGNQVLKARKVGVRVRNGSVRSGDTIKTGPGATAAVLFTDGTRVDMKPKTELQITEGPDIDLTKASQQKPVGRRIKVLVGEVLSEVVPNASIATEFETPSGVAAIKGTKITLTVDSAGNVTFSCDTGIALWNLPGESAYFFAPGGTNVRIDKNADGTYTVQNFGTDDIEFVVVAADGTEQTSSVGSGASTTVSAPSPTSSPRPKKRVVPQSCGECGIWNGTRCVDADSLCADLQCVIDRKCVGGTCSGGRELTADEDPACGSASDPANSPATAGVTCRGCGTAVGDSCVPDNSKCPDLNCVVDRVCGPNFACSPGRTLTSAEQAGCP